jgi:hypothetical protein
MPLTGSSRLFKQNSQLGSLSCFYDIILFILINEDFSPKALRGLPRNHRCHDDPFGGRELQAWLIGEGHRADASALENKTNKSGGPSTKIGRTHG